MSKSTKSLSALGLSAVLGTAAVAGETEERMLQMIASGDAYSADTLMPLFKQLEPVSLCWVLSGACSSTCHCSM